MKNSVILIPGSQLKVFTFWFCHKVSQGVVLKMKLYFQKSPQPNIKPPSLQKPKPTEEPNDNPNPVYLIWLLGFIWCHKLEIIS